MGYLNGKKLFMVMGTTEAPVDVPNKQATTTVILNALTNLNGRVLSAYTATLTTIGGYEVYQIKKDNEVLTEAQASSYMEFMTGSKFVPEFNYEKPQNSILIMASDLSVWKPQFDSTNGLLLYATSIKLASKGLVFNNVTASDWISDNTYADYSYKCELTCNGITENSVVEVIFDVNDAMSGNYAPVCLSGANKVTIYSKVNTSITIPTIKEVA